MSSCWVCGGTTASFYRVSAIPTSSCVLHLDASAARDQPTGDLDLHVCSTCGFIQNDSFDQAHVDYLAPYEESQGSSSTFVAFMNAEIDRLGSEYDLHGRRVVDVGCGKGEWLASACSRLGMTGLGIDPAYVPGRVDGDREELFEVLTEYFGPDHSITGDLVACRHTLEHIGNPKAFMQWLASAATGDPGVVFTEVPDTTRILDEGAFWDVYYEHASYFTPTSLRNLHHVAGMSIERLDRGFSDQYLLSVGRSADAVPGIADPTASLDGVQRFRERATRSVESWRTLMSSFDADRRVVWAATSKTVAFLAAVNEPVAAAVDINPAKQGSFLPGTGTPVIAPDDLALLEPDLVVLMNPVYEPEVRSHLEQLGVETDLRSLGSIV